jgi:hypothetical protein
MFRGFARDGMLGGCGAGDRIAGMVGRPLRTWRTFAEETARQWRQAEGERDERVDATSEASAGLHDCDDKCRKEFAPSRQTDDLANC